MDQYGNETTIYYPSEGRISEILFENEDSKYNLSRELYRMDIQNSGRENIVSEGLEIKI